MNRKERRGLYFEELPKVGKVMNHEKTYKLTLFRQYFYALLTLNPALIHLSNKEAKKQGFKGIIANGSHMEGVVMALTVRRITQKTIFANKEVTTKNLKPIYIGDTIRVKTKFGKKIASKYNPNKGTVYLTHEGYINKQRKAAITVKRKVIFRRIPR
jgi:acyl dehydratase